MKRHMTLLLAGAVLYACQRPDGGSTGTTVPLDGERYVSYIKTLSSDAFMGRKPFTPGDSITVNYLADEFRRIGLEPGNGDSYFQPVPMVEIYAKPAGPMTFRKGGSAFTLEHSDDVVIGSPRATARIDIPSTEVVFAGFGIVAPEYEWNDYAGIDVRGKTVIVLVNDPGFYNKNLFKGDTMTYYGRWTYKFEEAARQGAAGVLIVHDTEAASYGWNVVRSSWGGPQLYLESADGGASRAAFEGWISAAGAEQLFELVGVGDSLVAAAKKPGFRAVSLGIRTGISLSNAVRKSASSNVVAKLTGSTRPEEYIVYSAHWDHLGIGDPVDGDSIYNGAIDNASGVAALLELAHAFKAAEVPPGRSILFLAVTAEEQGLFGSAYYAENPVYPLSRTVANINIDALSPVGPTRDIAVIGLGHSDMDDYAQRTAARLGRTVVPGGNPSAGSFFRSDHFSFAKVGVPALYTGSGKEVLGKDSTTVAARREAFGSRYHHVSDEYDDSWDITGMLEDIRFIYDVGYTLSQETSFPGWKPRSEFKSKGDARFQ